MRWLEYAWTEEGVAEVKGPQANPTIVEYFAAVGRPEITSDEISWCAAFVGACLKRADVPLPLAKDKLLLARSYLDVGTPIDVARPGAIAVFTRGDPAGWQGHVGFVVGETATHVAVLGGNQSNKVCVAHFPKSQLLGLRWPIAPTAKDLVAAGSRTTVAAERQVKDGGKVGVSVGSEQVVPPPPANLGLEGVAEKAGSFKGAVETLEQFLLFAWGKWPWVAGGLAAYFVIRMMRDGWTIRKARVEDASTGANIGRAADAQAGG